MAEFFNMPMLGQSMEEGTVLRWFKAEGDSVRAGEPLLEVMSDKANIEVEAPRDGVVRRILAAADATVPVNTPVAILGTAEEPIDALLNGASAPATEPRAGGANGAPGAVHDPQPSVATASSAEPAEGRVAISPRARRMADERGVPIAALAGHGTGPGGRVLERDVAAYLERSAALVDQPAVEARPRVTPLAARIADDLGVDLEQLALGLPGSRVTAEVVRQHAAPRAGTSGEPAVAAVIPYKGLRKLIADNVARARQTIPHVTLVSEVDMAEAAALQAKLVEEIQRAYGVKPTYTHLLVKAAAKALADHSLCNAALIGDEIRCYADKNIGVAMATEAGLIVPVVKSAEAKTLGEVAVELRGLAERCRTGKQTPDDLAGGTFTITNLGAFGVDLFDPVINLPQSCILGVGRIVEKPVVVNGAVVVRPMMNLCLSFDHRILDGAPAARFLQRLRELLESPLLIFV